MAEIQEVQSDISVSRAFRRLTTHVGDVFDAAELRIEGSARAGSPKHIASTDLILFLSQRTELGEQKFNRTLSLTTPSGRTVPLMQMVSVKTSPKPKSTIEDAVPSSITLYPATSDHIRASIARQYCRPEDKISTWIGDTSLKQALTAENVRGLGSSLDNESALVSELPEENVLRLSVINSGLRIATASVVSLVNGQPTKTVLDELRAAHMELFII